MWTVPTNASTRGNRVLRVDRVCDGALLRKVAKISYQNLKKQAAGDVPVRGGPRRPLARIAHSRISL